MRLRFRRKPDLRGGKPADDMIFIINRIINPGLIFTGREINHSIYDFIVISHYPPRKRGNDSNLLIVFYVQIMPDDFVMQLHRF